MNLPPQSLSLFASLKVLGAEHRGVVVHAFFLSLAINLLAFAVPLHMLQIYDRVLSSRHIETLVTITFAILIALVIQALLDHIRSRLLFGLSRVFELQVQTPIYQQEIAEAARGPASTLSSPWFHSQTIKNFMNTPWMGSLLDLPWVPVYITVIFIFHPLLGQASVVGALIMIAIAFLSHKHSRKATAESNTLLSESRNNLELAKRNADAMLSMGMTGDAQREWEKRLANADEAAKGAFGFSSAVSAFSKFFKLLLQVTILSLGAYLVLRNEMSPGAIIANSILLSRALAPIELLASGWKGVQEASTSTIQLATFLQKPAKSLESPANNIGPSAGTVQVESLYFHRGNPPRPILKGVNFTLDQGDMLALIGPSGSGKSTLLRLIAGILVATGGACRLNGNEIQVYGDDFRKENIGYLPQHVTLFPGTIAQNIARLQDSGLSKLHDATATAGCHDMIMQLANGYDTEIDASGAGLSHGQQQRIGLARALYGNPTFIFLDEPNSNLDAEGDAALQYALKSIRERKATAIIVAHRSFVLSHCTKILMLKQGGVLAFGPRDEVLQRFKAQSA